MSSISYEGVVLAPQRERSILPTLVGAATVSAAILYDGLASKGKLAKGAHPAAVIGGDGDHLVANGLSYTTADDLVELVNDSFGVQASSLHYNSRSVRPALHGAALAEHFRSRQERGRGSNRPDKYTYSLGELMVRQGLEWGVRETGLQVPVHNKVVLVATPLSWSDLTRPMQKLTSTLAHPYVPTEMLGKAIYETTRVWFRPGAHKPSAAARSLGKVFVNRQGGYPPCFIGSQLQQLVLERTTPDPANVPHMCDENTEVTLVIDPEDPVVNAQNAGRSVHEYFGDGYGAQVRIVEVAGMGHCDPALAFKRLKT